MSACEIVHSGPAHRLPRGSDEVTVRCTDCGGSFTTSERNHRRIQAGEAPGTCKGCKRPKIKIREGHLRYWLLMFGADMRGRTAAEYVHEEGLPSELALICEEMSDCVFDATGVGWQPPAMREAA